MVTLRRQVLQLPLQQMLQSVPVSGIKLLHSAADARYVAEARQASGEETGTDTEEPRHRTSWCQGRGEKEGKKKKTSSLEASSQDIRE